ncbi:PEP/pyruvate-binding domain-containing protein [Alkalilimnicola ehrlichii]|nr:PEP/pyruvate-binding domain-containing protein [Alkalilimnicola ehrlichii]
MVDADTAGVAFSADAVSGARGSAVIAAVYGLGTGLVSGDIDADTFRVDRTGRITETTVADQPVAYRMAPAAGEGVAPEHLPATLANQPALTDAQVREVAALARTCERHFGCPQDIEWAFEDGRLYLLQSRPITTLAHLPDPDGELNIWDNSNIAESYSGITTPLTFSFARGAYEAVYRQFCRLMRVPQHRIEANRTTFRRMLGLIRGRVYYNLLNWYRVLALLPGFTVNRGFMEQMMGVRESLPPALLAEHKPPRFRDRLVDSLYLTRSLGGIVSSWLRLPAQTRHFQQRLERALTPPTVPLEQMRPDELVRHYHALEAELLERWDAPLVNDFFAMIFYGTLRRLSSRWCHDDNDSLHNDLLVGEGGMISTEPARWLRVLAELARQAPALPQTLAEGSLPQIRQAITQHTAFTSTYQGYLDLFGDRCLDELKLESPTLRDDPLPLLRAVGQLAQRADGQGLENVALTIRTAAEQRVDEALKGHPLRRWAFRWVLRHTRARVVGRENLRFERTRVFGRVRRIFIELGRRLHANGLLETPQDIFYLELEEALRYTDGTATCTDLKGLIAIRRREFESYRTLPAPADRFETRGLVAHGQDYRRETPAAAIKGDLKGLACCPGVVRGRVRVVREPRDAVIREGEILVAERTDPGWIMLLSAASGILVEHGSLLSHAAIVSRELGIPAIVAVADITHALTDGEWIEMDGARGVIRRLGTTAEEAA